jgi:hypothetical protein
MNTSENQNAIFPKGEKASSDYFAGTAWLNILVPKDETGSYVYNRLIKKQFIHVIKNFFFMQHLGKFSVFISIAN